VVLLAGVVIEARAQRIAAYDAEATPAAGLIGFVDGEVAMAGLGRGGIVLGLAGILPVALVLFGGPRRKVLVTALWLWAASSAATLAVLWSWTRLPAA
jgi:hypothetical protein